MSASQAIHQETTDPTATLRSKLPSYEFVLGTQAQAKLGSTEPIPIHHQVIPVEYDDYDETLRVGAPIPHPGMDEPVEERFCLASLFPEITQVDSYTFRARNESEQNDAVHRLRQDPMGEDRLYTVMQQAGHDLYGGTGLNAGRFYGIDWSGHAMTKAYEPLSYLSLLFTPIAKQADGSPLLFTDLEILVVSDEAMDQAGLPAGYGTALTWQDFGQIRAKVGEHSVAKGVAIGFETAKQVGLRIPSAWESYDLVVCESDIKIGGATSSALSGAFAVTYDNIQTIAGQPISLGYEFWQFLELEETVLDSLKDIVLTHPLPSYASMVLGLENSKRLAAARNGEEYTPLQIHSKVMEALTVLGPTYPWVAEQLERTVFNYLMKWSFPGTAYRLAIVVHDWVKGSCQHTEASEAKVIAGKYPVTAGLMTLGGECDSTEHFLVLGQATADQFNIDSDGDCVFVCRGDFFNKILDRDLVKPVRDIAVQGRQKITVPLSLANQAKYGWRIFANSSDIGALTIGYYLSEVANDVYDFDLDLSVYFQGIEAVIKSAKWDMDLQRVQYRDREVERLLKKEMSMPYARRSVKQLSKAVNTGVLDVDTALQETIAHPAHYMEHLWNWLLERAQLECETLRERVQELSYFADHIGPVLLPEDTTQLDREIDHIKALNNLWGELRPGGQLEDHAPQLAQTVSKAGQVFSTEALRIAIRSYLQYARGRGSFPIHLAFGRLNTIFDGTQVQYSLDRESSYEVFRVYSPEIEEATFQVAASVTLDAELPETPETLFLPGDQCSVRDFSQYELVTAYPYLNRRGQFTKSLWLVVQG